MGSGPGGEARHAVASGKPLPGAYPPFGLLWADATKTRLVLDPETAPAVRAIFSLALEGVSLRGIAAEMEQRGSPRQRECPVVRDQRRHILDPLDLHRLTGGLPGARDTSSGRRTDPSPGTSEEQIIVPNVAPALVSAEEMATVTARLATNKQTSTRNNRIAGSDAAAERPHLLRALWLGAPVRNTPPTTRRGVRGIAATRGP